MKRSEPNFPAHFTATTGGSGVLIVFALGMLAVLTGCTSEPAYFRANLVRIEMEQDADEPVTEDQQRVIANTLLAIFGDPDDPANPFGEDQKIAAADSPLEDFGFDLEKLRIAAGPVYRDAEGDQHGLYRLHCAHCHGITGDGGGPTAPFLNPYPRDYRQGVFKFKSTFGATKPTRDDLKRTLLEGIPGTSMPSFKLLSDNEIEALLEYVKYLSVRGETEIALIGEMASEGEMPGTVGEIAGGFPIGEDADGRLEEPEEENVVATIIYEWDVAPASIIHPVTPSFDFEDPDLMQASIDRGRELFYSKDLQCNSCHGDSAQGDGQTDKYGTWFKWREDLIANNADPEKVAATVDRFMDIGALRPRTDVPRNLRMGVFRGGRRPIDIYRRVASGIYGGPMPGQGNENWIPGDKAYDKQIKEAEDRLAQATDDAEKEELGKQVADLRETKRLEIEKMHRMWDVVNYVRSLQFESLSAEAPEREGVGLRPR